ncbi:hypothetical protein DJFAAGMI_04491 [Comamonas sp. PE63]|uniref:Uncharacterized protein n=1 Tax=Comamonas brasiliensis TaxID=1812482 RepID=A0ABS5LZM0_9BURK|nr:hypothetical protein [Comamonas sp. PE63]MBS3021716.1 hypothetical protein [Comamonas sp. PE63]
MSDASMFAEQGIPDLMGSATVAAEATLRGQWKRRQEGDELLRRMARKPGPQAHDSENVGGQKQVDLVQRKALASVECFGPKH